MSQFDNRLILKEEFNCMSQELSEVHRKVVKPLALHAHFLLDYNAMTPNLGFASFGIIWTSPVPFCYRQFALALSPKHPRFLSQRLKYSPVNWC